MRRALTIAMVMLFGLAPLFALIPGAEEATLPACCRRHGAHHCAMAMAASHASAGSPAFSATDHCPQYNVQVRALTPTFVLPSIAFARSGAESRIVSNCANQTLASRAHAHAGRGPPQVA